MSRNRNICFTSYATNAAFTEWTELPLDVRYIVWQYELCPSTGREHCQGYLELRKAYRWNAIKDLLGDPEVHLEARLGTPQQAAQYCKDSSKRSDGTEPVELGTCGGGQGKRNDLEHIAELVLQGESQSSIAFQFPSKYIRYSRGFRALAFVANAEMSKTYRHIKCLVLWGSSGTGKTRLAHLLAEGDGFVLDDPDGQSLWFDGYEGQRTLIIDDFTGWIRFRRFLSLLEGHQVRLGTKGGHSWLLVERIIITSNMDPRMWFPDDGFPYELERRLTVIKEITENLVFVADIIPEIGLDEIDW